MTTTSSTEAPDASTATPDTCRTGSTPEDLYVEALLQAEAPPLGRRPPRVRLRDESGAVVPFELERFVGRDCAGDAGLLDRCGGPTLDVGCGPGRLVAALHARGVPVLGIDVVRGAVRLARARAGDALVLERSVFERVPGSGRWRHVLLADGNLGIGGDVDLLLGRVAELLAPGGDALVETAAPGYGLHRARVRLERLDGRTSPWFTWARSDVHGLLAPAGAAGLSLVETWEDSGRHFCVLRREGSPGR